MQDIQNTGKQPLISFIVPCYNVPSGLLQACLESIKALALADDEREIVVVDDGSEPTVATPLPASDDGTVYVRQPHAGLAAARNRGISVSRGRWLQFVDADDMLLPRGYNHVLNLLRQREPDMLAFGQTAHDAPSRRQPWQGPLTGVAFMTRHNVHASACGYLFRRQTLGDLRFTVGLLHEDEEFTPLLLLRVETLYMTDTRAYYYRRRPGSITHDRQPSWIRRRLDDMHRVTLRLREAAEGLPPMAQAALGRRVAQLTMDYIYNVARLTGSTDILERRLQELQAEGLFPLPARRYTLKYRLFRRLTATPCGRKALVLTTKHRKRP